MYNETEHTLGNDADVSGMNHWLEVASDPYTVIIILLVAMQSLWRGSLYFHFTSSAEMQCQRQELAGMCGLG
jgi:hypothetical protein